MSKDHKAILKECVDAPFGKAEEILKQRGCWDEARGKENRADGLKIYRVRVTGWYSTEFDDVYTVEAEDDDEAEDLAIEKAESEYGDVEVDETGIESCK